MEELAPMNLKYLQTEKEQCSQTGCFRVDRFGRVEEPAPMNSTVVVPRIIHQTWKTEDVPEIWLHARK